MFAVEVPGPKPGLSKIRRDRTKGRPTYDGFLQGPAQCVVECATQRALGDQGRLDPGAAALRQANPMENPTFCGEWEREGELE